MPAQFVSVKQAFDLFVGSDRALLMVCSAFRGHKDGCGKLTVEEDSQGRALALRVGQGRLQPEGGESAEGSPPRRQMELLSVEGD